MRKKRKLLEGRLKNFFEIIKFRLIYNLITSSTRHNYESYFVCYVEYSTFCLKKRHYLVITKCRKLSWTSCTFFKVVFWSDLMSWVQWTGYTSISTHVYAHRKKKDSKHLSFDTSISWSHQFVSDDVFYVFLKTITFED